MKALVLGGFANMDSDTKQQYWAEVSNKDIDEQEAVMQTNIRKLLIQ